MTAFLRFAALALVVFGVLLAVGTTLKRREPGPPPAPEGPAPTPSPISLPGGFPAEHAGYALEASQKDTPPAGVESYHAAIYWGTGSVESEIGVRLLALKPATAAKFAAATLDHIASLKGTKELPSPGLPEDSGWVAARLFTRNGAGIYAAWNASALLLVAGPCPAAAKSFGSTLVLKP